MLIYKAVLFLINILVVKIEFYSIIKETMSEQEKRKININKFKIRLDK